MLKKSHSILGFLLLIVVMSCTKDFEEINTNPNQPIAVQPELLLRQVIYNYAEEMTYEGFVAGNLLGQYFTAVDFNLFDRHSLSEPQFGGNPWPVLYKNLRDLELLILQAEQNKVFEIYLGPAKILKATIAATLTDLYGDVPYFNAVKGLNGVTSPSYDSQESIYLNEGGILSLLQEAVVDITSYEGAAVLGGDILYEGRLTQWIKLANSLQFKYLLRISDRESVGNQLQSLVNAGAYISTSVDDAFFEFTDNLPNNFRMATLREGDFNLFVMSETIAEVFDTLNDPRIELYFRPTGANDTVYNGLLNGPDASSISVSIGDYSLAGTLFRENSGGLKAHYMTSWEMNFLLAEAAERGLISGSAEDYYNTGVADAFVFWNASLPSDYLSIGSAAFKANGANGLSQIISQKWLANIINGYEGWVEYRRTGYPELKTVAASLNNGLIPIKLPYPADEQALNFTNFFSITGGNNSVNTAVWWDVN